MSSPGFWDNREEAQEVVGKVSHCRAILDPFNLLQQHLNDFLALVELIQEDGEDSELLGDADKALPEIEAELAKLELVSFLGGKFDKNNAILTFHPGSGGTESCDWAQMLFRMYFRWAERNGFKTEIIDMQPGEVAGIKNAILMVTGDFAYGYLRSENGVHRLVRISPFDSNKRRHTSFAALEVAPEISDDIDIEIEEKDIKMDTFRSSGAGGQHVNTTDSAVRITHIPTGIVVACQNQRSQHQNRATAMRVLRSRLYERQLASAEEEKLNATGPKEENAWGSQIRSYVLHPYQMVKDLRTGEETSDSAGVLDGKIDNFIESFLKTKSSDEN